MTGSLRRRVGIGLGAADAVIVALALLAAYAIRFTFELGGVAPVAQAPIERYVETVPVVVLSFLIVLKARGLHDELPLFGIDVVERTLSAASLGTVAVLAFLFFYRREDFAYSRTVPLITWGLTSLFLPIPRLAILARRRRRYAAGLDLAPAVVVGSPAASRELLGRLRDRSLFGLDLRGVILPAPTAPASVQVARRQPELVPAGLSIGGSTGLETADEIEVTGTAEEHEPIALDLPVLGRTDELEKILEQRGIVEVLVTDELPKPELLAVIATCERLDRELRIIPAIYDLCITAQDLSNVHGIPFIAIREQRTRVASLALKRTFDLVLGTTALLLLSPLFLFLIAAIRLGSKGPAFFKQPRVGENGRVFLMWKFRSMVPDAAARLKELVDLDKLAEPVFKLENDPRITPIGRFLRRWSLDELPQLWNIVKGDMSIVGPRPEEEAVVKRYDPHQRRRLKAKPGLTGLQQIEARASESLEERIRLDVLYIRRRTFLFDLWIIFRTPLVVLSGKGAR